MCDSHTLNIRVLLANWRWVMKLQDVVFNVSFSSLVGLSSMGLGIQATLKVRSGTVFLAGHCSKCLFFSFSFFLLDTLGTCGLFTGFC